MSDVSNGWEDVDPLDDVHDSGPNAPLGATRPALPASSRPQALGVEPGDDDENVFGGKIDGLVFARQETSPELRWKPMAQPRPTVAPPRPAPGIQQPSVEPWEPGGPVERPEPRAPLPASARLIVPLMFLAAGGVVVAMVVVMIMRMYGFLG